MMSAGKVEKAKIIEAVKVAEPLIPQPNLDKAAEVFITQGKDFCEQEKAEVLKGDETKREICESGFLDGVLRDADELEKYFKDNGIPEVAQRLADGDRFIRTPYKNRDSNSPRAWWHDYLWRVADTYPKLKEKLEAAGKTPSDEAKPAGAPAKEADKKPVGIAIKGEGSIPAPGDDAGTTDTSGTLTGSIEYSRSVFPGSSHDVNASVSLSHRDAAGSSAESINDALIAGLKGRSRAEEWSFNLSWTLPLNDSNDMKVPPMDLVSASPLAQKLTEKAKARWGDKAAQIYLDAVRATFEVTDEDGFSALWSAMTQGGAGFFESLLSDSNLPTKTEAQKLAAFFGLQPSGLIDFLALLSGKSVEEIRAALKSKGVDLEKFEASKNLASDTAGTAEREELFTDLLKKAGTLGLTKQFKLADKFDDYPSVSTIKLPADPVKFKEALGLDGYAKALKAKEEEIAKALGMTQAELKKAAEDAKVEYPFELTTSNDHDNPWRVDASIKKFRDKKLGDKVATMNLALVAGLGNDFAALDASLALSMELSYLLFEAMKNSEDFFQKVSLTLQGGITSLPLLNPPKDGKYAFESTATLMLGVRLLGIPWDVTGSWTGVGAMPKNGGDFAAQSNKLAVGVKANKIWKDLYATAGYTEVIPSNIEQQTAPGGLNDSTSGQGSGGPLSVLLGRDQRDVKFGVGYQVTDTLSVGVNLLHTTSCDASSGNCISRLFSGANFTGMF